MTEYVVLHRNANQPSMWTVIEKVTATNASAAIRDVARATDAPDGTFVAIPTRSWQPTRLTRHEAITYSISEAAE